MVKKPVIVREFRFQKKVQEKSRRLIKLTETDPARSMYPTHIIARKQRGYQQADIVSNYNNS